MIYLWKENLKLPTASVMTASQTDRAFLLYKAVTNKMKKNE